VARGLLRAAAAYDGVEILINDRSYGGGIFNEPAA
jgi:hypothetical protein